MTWEGFIDVYNEAVKMYGDTSDFFIHFRITSRGTTDLENCHPFQVDDNMMIMHNGTIIAIPDRKKDPRSDTRRFAEDYLRFLPENWEDNGIISDFIEDFIGSSKVCMLHKTKGYYIYNEAYGVWDSGIWYSNTSYLKAYDYYTHVFSSNASAAASYYKNGFYSVRDDKWIFKEEASKLTYSEYKAHEVRAITDRRTYADNPSSWVRCSLCLDEGHVDDFIKRELDGEVSIICDVCSIQLHKKLCIGCNNYHDEQLLETYYSCKDEVYVNLCVECAEWAILTEIDIIKVINIITDEENK